MTLPPSANLVLKRTPSDHVSTRFETLNTERGR